MRSISATIASGSGSRPLPYSPQAISPSSGSITCTPSARSMARLRWVALWCHMRTFIAGTASTGLSVASSSVVARSSAIPFAIFARILAVAGATTTSSACRDNWICPISRSAFRSNRSSNTWSSVNTPRLSGVTNCLALSVSTARTAIPRLRNPRTSSNDL